MILDILTIVGATYLVTRSSIFKPLREFASNKNSFIGELLSCPLCLGFWMGIVYIFIPENIRESLAFPFIGALASFIIYLIIERIKKD